MKICVIALLAAALVACGGGSRPQSPSAPIADSGWQIGPVIKGKNYSRGLPAAMGDSISLGGSAEPHYVTRPTGLLSGMWGVRFRFAVELSGDARIEGAGCPGSPGSVTVHFQSPHNDWKNDGGRWWATFATVTLAAGEYEVVAPFSGRWTSVHRADSSSPLFARDLASANRIGFTFGNCDGYGHGVVATGPGRFILREFTVLQSEPLPDAPPPPLPTPERG